MIAVRSARAVWFALALLAATGPVAAQPSGNHAAAVTKATNAAQSWLALVDDGQFRASWDSAAVLLQKKTKRADWIQQAERLRDSVQAVSSRTLTRTQYRDSLQQVPRGGPFVLLKYRSSFATGRFEELVLTVRQDTTWKVTGYQVTPLRRSTTPSTAPHRSSSP